MSKSPQLNIYKRPEKPKPYYLNISAKLSDTGKRTALAFSTLTEAKNARNQLRNKIKREGREGYTFTKKEAVDAKRVFELLKNRDDNLHDVVREALEARGVLENANLKNDHELSLIKAARLLVEDCRNKDEERTYDEVYKRSVRDRKKKKGKWSSSYTRDNDWLMKGPKPHPKAPEENRDKEKGFLHHFGSRLIDEITEDEIRGFMDKYCSSSPRKYNYCRTIIGPAFKHAEKRGWIKVNPMNLIEKTPEEQKPTILRIRHFNRCAELMNTDKYQSLAVPIALLMFSGMRRDELKGNKDKKPLRWENIITNPAGAHTVPYISMSPEQAKGKYGRQITIAPNLLKWIETVPESERVGFIIPSAFDSLMKKFRLEAGIVGMRNAFRHSFGAYHFHRWSDQGATMKELGHTERNTFMEHYYAWNPEEDAPHLYWQLLPQGVAMENVVPMPSAGSAL